MTTRRNDITGKTFGKLTVVSYHGLNKKRIALWNCECICGNTVVQRGCELRKNTNPNKSCGCLRYNKSIEIGSVYSSNSFGDFEVLNYKNSRNVVIRFLNTGSIGTVTAGQIRNGQVRDYYTPTVYGVGILGKGVPCSVNNKATREYTLWNNMLDRCYGNVYPTYENVTVCDRWLNYQNFYKDIQELQGYDLWLNDNNYQLDKDKLSGDTKQYNIDNCCFITSSENVRLSNYKRVKDTIEEPEIVDGGNPA